MLIVTGSILAQPDVFDALRAEAVAHSARSRAENGCISHNVYVDCEEPMRIFFFERWADRGALRAHFAAAGTEKFLAAIARHGAKGGRPRVYVIAEDEES